MPETVYKSTYSNVPVFEVMVKSIPVMRRRHDDWMNATQILKVAGFDKPQRTRILEREVQKGEHEKVQGGYGKYQGTWIPFSRGHELAHQYDVYDHLKAILEYHAGGSSPPPAPKHQTAASTRGPAKVTGQTRQPRKQKLAKPVVAVARARATSSSVSDASIDDLPSARSPSPGQTELSLQSDNEEMMPASDDYGPMYEQQIHISGYSERLLEFFTDPKKYPMPEFLRNPPPDYDANTTIDDEGHTALHWAAAMGLLDVVAYLLDAQARIDVGNAEGQTPFMRVVAFCNNYDLKTFPQIVRQLLKSVVYRDNENRTVLHHIALITGSGRAKLAAARYYAEQLLYILADEMTAIKLSELINFQDRNGDTALTICARNGARKVQKLLLSYQASPDIPNHDGRTAQEYMDAHEASIKTQPGMSSSSPTGPGGGPTRGSSLDVRLSRTQHISETGRAATHRVLPSMADKLKDLASTYDYELREKELDLQNARGSLEQMQQEMEELRRYLTANSPTDIAYLIKQAEAEEAAHHAALHQAFEASQVKQLATFVVQASGHETSMPTDMAKLRQTLLGLQQQRKEKVLDLVSQFGSTGVGGRMKDYRRLIATSCGIAPQEVDDLLGPIEELLVQQASQGEERMGGVSEPMPGAQDGSMVGGQPA
ncbi:hypothetical protein BCR37DRAFT_379666 [Protomyces lactucae-debilis]|uniref:HTH APSES-type domain-containing protein n=1 Tax=Protomyces lactucae-debilis TaxID=2754530 RepID=A0A1Y2FFC5_PROLT|nr:uncharacterized protein BCR37DRAFT_379666 [Protomyces lactucae-debilis]ORY82648.1 hypothetical protein BCR37DRAFT_379666 [Protomyces lactucae-debilis]